jgi:hypothetical protein
MGGGASSQVGRMEAAAEALEDKVEAAEAEA